MLAVKARFDGKRIILPKGLSKMPPGEVIVVFGDARSGDAEKAAWMRGAS